MSQAYSFFMNHSPITAVFCHTARDFVVTEIPLYPFSNSGEHLVLSVRKKNLSTLDALKILSTHLGIKARDIGYAGLKDKYALTLQHISIPYASRGRLESFSHSALKILSATRHNNKLKIGHLKGNNFFIRLKKVSPHDAEKITKIVAQIQAQGFPNYFGYQRFGTEGDNFTTAIALIKQEKRLRSKKLNTFLLNALQSHYFNQWLSARIVLSKLIALAKTPQELKSSLQIALPHFTPLETFLTPHFLKNAKKQSHSFTLLAGDVCCHYPFGKYFILEDSKTDRFFKKEIAPTGLLYGDKVIRATLEAGSLEEGVYSGEVLPRNLQGGRRFAWVFPEGIKAEYVEKEAWLELGFFLPKGSYATSLLREVLHTEPHSLEKNAIMAKN